MLRQRMARISSPFEDLLSSEAFIQFLHTVDHEQTIVIKSCAQRNCKPTRNIETLAVNDNWIRSTYTDCDTNAVKTSVWGKCWQWDVSERRTLRVIYRWSIVDIIRPNILNVMYVYLLLLPILIYPDVHGKFSSVDFRC